jgi:NitT/TauT family transport system substrate-binding protein
MREEIVVNRLWTITLMALALMGAACAPPTPASSTGAPSAARPEGAAAPQAAGLQKATLRLDWLYIGNNTMYVIAQDKGFYREEGVDIEIGQGKGSASTAQLVGSGQDMFGVADTGTAALAIAKGVPITVLGSWVQKNTNTITVLESGDIKTPQDLKGRRIGSASGGAPGALLPAFLEANGMGMSDISVVNVEAASVPSSLAERKVDGIAVFATGDAVIVELGTGNKVRNFLYADSGINVLGTGLIVNNDVLNSNPDLVRRMVRATVRGWEYAQEHPEETVDAGLKRSEAGKKDVFMRQLTDTFAYLHTNNSEGKPLGWMSEADWDESLKLLKQYFSLQTDRPARDFYTNDFLPTQS